MPSVGRRKAAKGDGRMKKSKQVIVIDEDEEEVSETSNSSDSDFVSTSSEKQVEENGEASVPSVGNGLRQGQRPKPAPRIKRFTRKEATRQEFQGKASQVVGVIEDSEESDCEVLSAVQWDEVISKRKAATEEKLPRKRAKIKEEVVVTGSNVKPTGAAQAKPEAASSRRFKQTKQTAVNGDGSNVKPTGAAHVKPEVVTPRHGKNVSVNGSPGVSPAEKDKAAKSFKQSSGNDQKKSAAADEFTPARSVQESGLPAESPRPVSGGNLRKAPHLDTSATGRASKAAQFHTVPTNDLVDGGSLRRSAEKKENVPEVSSVSEKGTRRKPSKNLESTGAATSGREPESTNELVISNPSAFDRETRRQSVEFQKADELEWASRQRELERQAQEARKEREKRKREREVESRQKQRVLEMRESQEMEQKLSGMKEQLRGVVRTELAKLTYQCTDMGLLLQRLGIDLGSTTPTVEQVNAGYKKARIKFHPDRAAANGDLKSQVEAEEIFKLISNFKSAPGGS